MELDLYRAACAPKLAAGTCRDTCLLLTAMVAQWQRLDPRTGVVLVVLQAGTEGTTHGTN